VGPVGPIVMLKFNFYFPFDVWVMRSDSHANISKVECNVSTSVSKGENYLASDKPKRNIHLDSSGTHVYR
jgi:hypothetical protein